MNVGASDEDKRQYGEFQKQIDAWVNWRDAKGRRAFVLPVEHCSDDAEVTQLDRISFAEWLQQNGFTSERLVWYCDYACRDDYGSKARADVRMGRTFLLLLTSAKERRRVAAIYHGARGERSVREPFRVEGR